MAVADAPLQMAGEDLDTTIARRLDEIAAAVTKKPSGLPPWVLPLAIFLVTQLAASLWWAATSTSDIRYLQAENAKLWQEIGVLKLKNEKIETGFDEKVRVKVRETLDDWGYLRVRPRKDE